MSRVFDYDTWQARIVALELANPVGRRILKALSEEPLTPSQVSSRLKVPLPTVLFHLSRLETAGVVESRRGLGKRLREVRIYSILSPDITFRLGQDSGNGSVNPHAGDASDAGGKIEDGDK